MDILRQGSDKHPPTPRQPVPAATHGGEVITTLGPDTEFEGTLKFKHTLQIMGKFMGSITTDGHVTVGESGNVKADIKAGSVLIAGTVNGNIAASDLVELHSTATVHGDVSTSRMKVEEGVVLVGDTQVMPKERRGTGGPAKKPQPPGPAEPPKPPESKEPPAGS